MAGYENLTAVNWSITDKVIASDNLQKSWRTQMGLFLLAQNEQVLLENISLVYCFFNLEGLTTIYKFSYSQEQHDGFKERLQATLSKLSIYHDADEQVIPLDENEAQLNLQKFASGDQFCEEKNGEGSSPQINQGASQTKPIAFPIFPSQASVNYQV